MEDTQLDKLAQILGADDATEEAIISAAKSRMEQLGATQQAFEDYKAAQEETQAERMITEAIEQDKKFPPAKREALETLAEENGIEALKQTISLVPVNAAGPASLDLAEPSTEETEDLIAAARASGKAVALDDSEAEFYRTAGKDFVRIEEVSPERIREIL